MKSKEALIRIQTRTQPYFLGLYEKEDYIEDLKIIEKDLEILDCFKKLFEGEDLYDWIEFNFSYTDEDENDNDYNYNDYVSLINKIRKWLDDTPRT